MCPNTARSRGFTLFEILVVMMLISLVTALTIPRIRTNLFADQLKASARRLVGFVTEVSQEAVRNQTDTVVNFDFEEGAVWASLGPGSSTGTDGDDEKKKERRLEIPESVRIVDVSTAAGGKNSQGTSELYISRKGYVDKTAIHLRDDDGEEMTIILSPFMGVIRIFDSYVELEDDEAGF